LNMSKLSYLFNLGWYVNGKMRPSVSYFKLGLHYDITSNIFAAITLRTQFARADFVGIGLGYKLPLLYYTDKK